MKNRITTRWLLVLLVTGVQLVCLLIGQAWHTERIREAFAAELYGEALRALHMKLAELAELMEHGQQPELPPVHPYEPGCAQELAPHQQLRLVSAGTGEILSPAGTPLPADAREPAMGRLMLEQTGGSRPLLEAVSTAKLSASGRLTIGGRRQLAAVRLVPGLGIVLVAWEPEDVITSRTAALVPAHSADRLAPLVAIVLLTALLTIVVVQRYENRLARLNANLEQLAERRSQSLLRTRDAVIFGLAKLAEFRDDDTGGHLERIRSYVELLARQLARKSGRLDEAQVAMLGLTSSLHDIGKVGIPDAVLLKPGELLPHERAIIERHPLIGGDCLMAIKEHLGEDDFLETACEIAFAHHERWDGAGYPFGLRGEQIPLSARIVALADTYDALTMPRVYKDALPHEAARGIIIDGAATQFDPRVVEAFVAVEAQFKAVAERYGRQAVRRRRSSVAVFVDACLE
jgi:putative two-component system response regulator